MKLSWRIYIPLYLWYFSPCCWRGWGVKHPWKSERRRGPRLELVPSPRLTKHCCSRKENANRSGEKRQEGPQESSSVRSLIHPPRYAPLPAPQLSGKCRGYFLLFTRGTARKKEKQKKEKKKRGKKNLMLKSRKKPMGQGQQWKQKQLLWSAQYRESPSRRRGHRQRPRRWQPEWQQLWGGPASPLCRLHGGTQWGDPIVPIVPIFWASTFFSFLHSRLSASADRLLPPLLWRLEKPVFFFRDAREWHPVLF